MPRWCRLAFFIANLAAVAFAQTPEQRTGRQMEAVRNNPPLLLAFLRDMPKGGDLHNHLSGAIYAESFVNFAAQDGLCVDRTTAQATTGPCQSCEAASAKPAAKCAFQDQGLYNTLVDAWSMRNWRLGHESGHDHFFATFEKFSPAGANHVGESIAEAASRAASDHLQYLELMHTADGMQSAMLGEKLGWNDDFATQRQQLLAGGLKDITVATRERLTANLAVTERTLRCGTPKADPGCKVAVRFLYQVLRGLPPQQVFAQILLGFELAQADPRFVGLNLVMPEDWYVPMRDFGLHMRILDYLHGVYPKVHITLHAGELAMGMVPPEGLRSHIRESIQKGHAERIGHGASVMYEDKPLELLREMSRKNTLVEICLTSNDEILGVKGVHHPLSTYRKFGVPVALATDDQGVSRGDMTQEYVQAVSTQALTYKDLKGIARQSIEHSFLPGKSLWADAKTFRRVAACTADRPETDRLSKLCQTFLNENERAAEQWKLETQFAQFERSAH
jgi:adenosine deaminase